MYAGNLNNKHNNIFFKSNGNLRYNNRRLYVLAKIDFKNLNTRETHNTDTAEKPR